MKAGLRPSYATWLVGLGVAGLLNFPQTPANAASSPLPPAHILEVIEEAAPEGETREVVRFWFSEADVINVIVRIGGQPHEFKVSGAGQLLWIGEPGAIAPPAPFVSSPTGPTSFSAMHAAAQQRVMAVVPDFEALSVELVPARTPYYRLVGDSSRGYIYISVKSTGALMSFDSDADRDGLGDAFEMARGWDPTLADTDGDGFPDGFEFEHPTGDPGNADEKPSLLAVRHDRESNVLVATLSTFKGAAFYLEYRDPEGGGWLRLGQAILGDGDDHEFAIPLGEGVPLDGLIRAGLTDPEEGVDTGDSLQGSGDQCMVPDSLVGRQLTVSGGHRLCFKSRTRGEELQGQGGALLVTPFAYTFRRAGHCKARLTINYNTFEGIQTVVYTLTFGSDGSASGAFAANSFSGGSEEDEIINGIFSMN